MRNGQPSPLASPLAASGRTLYASADCGFEREPGSGHADTAAYLHPLGSRDAISDDWVDDADAEQCASATTRTCNAILVHRTHPDWVQLVSVRRLGDDGWTRVVAIIELD